MSICIKGTSKICLVVVNEFWVFFTGSKKRKAWNKTRGKYIPEERRQNLARTDKGTYYNQEEWLGEFLDDKGAFYDGSESDVSENDENYTEKIEGVVRRCSSKHVFLKISQNSQESNCVGVSF